MKIELNLTNDQAALVRDALENYGHGLKASPSERGQNISRFMLDCSRAIGASVRVGSGRALFDGTSIRLGFPG